MKYSERKERNSISISSYFRLFRYADRVDIILMLIATFSAIMAGQVLPLFNMIMGRMISVFARNEETKISEGAFYSEIMYNIYMLIVIGIADFILSFLAISLWRYSGARQLRKYRLEFYSTLLRREISWFDLNQPSEIATRASSDFELIRGGLCEVIGFIVLYLSTFIGSVIVAFVICWELALTMCPVFPLLGLCGAYFTYYLSKITISSQKRYSQANTIAFEALAGIRTVFANNAQTSELDRFSTVVDGAARKNQKGAVVSGIILGLICFLIYCSYALSFWAGARLIYTGVIHDVGAIVSVLFCIVNGSFALGDVFPRLTTVSKAVSASENIFRIVDYDIKSVDVEKKSCFGLNADFEIEFKDISFSYPSRKDCQVLSSVSFTINSGQTVALVGSSGSGKSTISQLLQRFYPVKYGSIAIDDVSISEIPLSLYRALIGVVSQEPVLFDDTIMMNVALGAEDPYSIPFSTIVAACRAANAHSFIASLPNGYHTRVGEGGKLLSGGQKQRVAIARALIKNPSILILDEATSSLDSASEAVVQEAIDVVSKGRTTLVIAHRLSTIRNADKIIVMKDGRIIEEGNHASLIINKNSHYYALVQAQSSDVLSTDLKPTEYLESTPNSPIPNPFENLDHEIRGMDVAQRSTSSLEELAYRTGLGSVVLRILRLNSPDNLLLRFGLCAAVINGALAPMFSIVFADAQTIFASKSMEYLKSEANRYSLYMIGIGFISLVCEFVQLGFFGLAGERLTCRLRKLCFKSMLTQPVRFFDEFEHTPSKLAVRLSTESEQLNRLSGPLVGALFQALIGVGIGIVISFVSDWRLALILLLIIPAIIVSGYFEMKSLDGTSRNEKKMIDLAQSKLMEGLVNRKTVSSLSKETFFHDKYAQILQVHFKIFGAFGFALSQGLPMILLAIAFCFGTKLYMSNQISFSAMNRVIFSVIFTATSAGNAMAYIPNISTSKIAAVSIFDIIDSNNGELASEENCPYDRAVGVSFEDVHFSYPTRPTNRILNGVSCDINAGQTVAVVGRSGSGKSTLISLLQHFYDPQSGKVKVDGIDVRDWVSDDLLRRCFGYVGQEPVLFSRSIADNIRYGRRSASQKQIEEAARSAGIYDDIVKLPLGFNTPVGEGGSQLSGGQKQRIAIARALIRETPILLLDEATSALDTFTEKIVQRAIAVEGKNKTVIIVAHRLSTIQHADFVVVMDGGQVKESGTHQDLLAKKGLYYTLHQAQDLGA